ncbi:GntP family permease [Salicibibacter halophilus]|nr:GntP family permease [Salicibibacter halophilus]
MLSLIGIIISLVLLIILAFKGFGLLLVTPVLAVLVALTSNMDIVEALTGPYMDSFVGFAQDYFLIFLFSAIFGKVIADSGAAASIAAGIMKVIGKKSRLAVIAATMIITAALTYGGVSLFVAIFVVMPIARPIFKEMDIPWPIFIGSFALGAATFTMTMLPGTPQIQNIIPMTHLGTSPTSGALIGLVATAVVIPFGLWWLNREDKKYQKKNIGYEETKGNVSADTEEKNHYPKFIISIFPSALLLILINIVQLNIELSLALSVIAALVLFYIYLEQPLQTFNTGAMNVAAPILNTCAVVGFGGVVASTQGFEVMRAALLDFPGHPLISFAVAINVMVGITGSASGGLGIALETLADDYSHVNSEALHRIGAISSGGLDSLPHSGAVVTLLTVSGTTHRVSYMPVFWMCVVGPLIALAVALIPAIFFY